MKTKIYACYGVLGHEKEIVYSVTPTDICDEITVEIPESVKPYVTVTGSIAVVVPFFDGRHGFPLRSGRSATHWRGRRTDA